MSTFVAGSLLLVFSFAFEVKLKSKKKLLPLSSDHTATGDLIKTGKNS